MTRNRLAETASPYLRQHADNPVAWQPWDEAALAEARERNVPIHLSIGYAACHWCHVMAHESFSDPATAEVLNQGFVNIKVDREERPDIDQIYMRALAALGEPGGWPLTMFLTPAGEPFWGGTYFPPQPRFGRPSFRQVLAAIEDAWVNKRDAITANTGAILQRLRNRPPADDLPPEAPILDAAAAQLLTIWDHQAGGINGAPKFPQAPVLDLLWRTGIRTGTDSYRDAVLVTLQNICQGGIYDHLGGGFARYAVDDRWLVPHFEKMLSDNGQILNLLARAAERTGSPLFRQRISETADWLLREMLLPEGAFAASLDADTEGEEGATYVWTAEELQQHLGTAFDDFAEVYDVTRAGNWEGKNILNRLSPASFAWLGEERETALGRARASLLRERDRRPQPGRDYKILTDWNAVAISGLVNAASVLFRPDLLAAAERAFEFLLKPEGEAAPGRLFHAFADGRVTAPALATDYAQMMRTALDLYAETGTRRYLDLAASFFDRLEADFLDSDSKAYFLTSDASDSLIVRPHSDSDEAMPNANGVAAEAAFRLSLVTGDTRYAARGRAILDTHRSTIVRNIIGTASFQSAADTELRARHVSILPGDGAGDLESRVRAEADPALLRDAAAEGLAPGALRLCDQVRCYADAQNPEEAQRLLDGTRQGPRAGD